MRATRQPSKAAASSSLGQWVVVGRSRTIASCIIVDCCWPADEDSAAGPLFIPPVAPASKSSAAACAPPAAAAGCGGAQGSITKVLWARTSSARKSALMQLQRTKESHRTARRMEADEAHGPLLLVVAAPSAVAKERARAFAARKQAVPRKVASSWRDWVAKTFD